MGNASKHGARPRTKSSAGCCGTTGIDCTRLWPMSARCSSSTIGLWLRPNRPIHDLGYGIRNSGARSVLRPWPLIVNGQPTYRAYSIRSKLTISAQTALSNDTLMVVPDPASRKSQDLAERVEASSTIPDECPC